jgi:hypothetical protein
MKHWYLLVSTLFSILISYLLFKFNWLAQPGFLLIIGFVIPFYAIAFISLKWALSSLNIKPTSFITAFMGMVALKMIFLLIYLAVALVIIKETSTQEKLTVVGFIFTHYLLVTILMGKKMINAPTPSKHKSSQSKDL